jgi:peptidoglycan/xylan/chitin deacetylase (PgdA/CDA1 family)
MTRKLAFCLLLAAMLPFAGCGKIKEKVPFLKKKEEVTAATPAPAPVTAAAATPAPEPEPVVPVRPAIDTNAQVVVLCYHRLEGKAGGINSIEPALFEKQMEAIKESGVPVISMQDFLAWRRGEKNIPPRSILITLDDGYVSEIEVGVPILKKYGFPATFFVYLNYINKGGKSVTWAQLEQLRDDGFEIGSHTVSHLDLKHKPSNVPGDYEAWLKDEVGRSKKELEDKLGIRCATIAYPFGNHNEKVQLATKAAGYEAAFTTYGARLGHATNELTLGRYDVTAKMPGNQTPFDVAINFTGMVAPSGPPVMAQDAAVSMLTVPEANSTITDPQPEIKANLATMGALDQGSVVMRVSGIGEVPATYDGATKTVSYKVTKPLIPGTYTVIISAKVGGVARTARWAFAYDPSGEAPEAAATPVPKATPKKKK